MASSRDLLKGRNTLGAMQATAQSSAAASQTVSKIVGLPPNAQRVLDLPLEKIHPNPNQPRTVFDDEGLESLSASIDQFGLKQPILVSPEADGSYRIVAGERRFRAHKRLNRTTIMAIISTGNPKETAVVENAQRQDLNAIDLAFALHQLSDDYTQEELGKIAGLHRNIVGKLLKLVLLPAAMIDEFKAMAAKSGSPIPRTTMFQIASAESEDDRWRLWEAAKSGSTTRELEDARFTTASDQTDTTQRQDAPAQTKAPRQPLDVRRTVANAFKRIEKDVATLTSNATSLSSDERTRLEDLRRRIDDALSGA